MSDNTRCFICDGILNGEGMCRMCGATRQISEVSGNVIWVRGGRVLAAFQDEKEQWIEMSKRNGILEEDERWPLRFRTKE